VTFWARNLKKVSSFSGYVSAAGPFRPWRRASCSPSNELIVYLVAAGWSKSCLSTPRSPVEEYENRPLSGS
jgi:hypothetical protein